MAQNSQDLELTKVTVESKLLGAQTKNENAAANTDSDQSSQATSSKSSTPSSSTSSIIAQITHDDAKIAMLRETCQQFGFSDSLPPSTVYYTYLESLMRAKQIDKLREVLDVMGDNVKCVAHDLLSYATYIVDDEEILRDILTRNLPQDVIQSLFAELLQLSDWKLKQARIYCETHPELTRLFIHEASSFPLLLIVNKFTKRVSKAKENESNLHEQCIRRMVLLLKHGAEINARFLEEETPIHLAVKRGAWKVVEMLLAFHANIDIKIEGVTARETSICRKI